ncbi:hypothetical protein CAOG_05673 [Capsaspora owczarzaki ATCC 30864]|uniref:Transcriptional coactivator p15 (PC4) C-terminal domain-containing protein n=1 Tax=Capsaspora owczarzaki (strain ATCC 30864) TaxID=595528 RepID=A0A0D2WSL3_CAPO3|nr:hypothetical protein CAOG_05673 [Capsaspora owczarzaki ATCC 30864]KJE95195.1 hypothetical protein CAOG_005673 [Capsaspora owczarzaki ATCC 30864]|eukprot:XP_004346346.1 hypothetical protein CAOG_05673 [Capsaspora owczarzaki ATCC 30864]
MSANKYKTPAFVTSSDDDEAGLAAAAAADADPDRHALPTGKPPKEDLRSTAAAGAGAAGTGFKTSDGIAFNLIPNGKRRITVRRFSGKKYVDIREFYDDDSGELKPGKKGIMLNEEQFTALLGMADNIRNALQKI